MRPDTSTFSSGEFGVAPGYHVEPLDDPREVERFRPFFGQDFYRERARCMIGSTRIFRSVARDGRANAIIVARANDQSVEAVYTPSSVQRSRNVPVGVQGGASFSKQTVMDRFGVIHQALALPSCLIVDGDMVIQSLDGLRLPHDLNASGNVSIICCVVTGKLERLVVGGHLDITNSSLEFLPVNSMIGGNLYALDSGLERLPEGLSVGGALSARGSAIARVGKAHGIGGSICLTASLLSEIEDGVVVNGSLRIGQTPIERLPNSLTVNGDLVVTDTAVPSLGEKSVVLGDVYASKDDFVIPKSCQIKGRLLASRPFGYEIIRTFAAA